MTEDIIELLKKVSKDLQIEIVENLYTKKWTESELADIQQKLKQQMQKSTRPGTRTDLNETNLNKKQKDPDRIDEKIGKMFNESRGQVNKREQIFKNADKKIQKDVDKGKLTLNAAYNQMISAQNNAMPTSKLPNDKYHHIVEDPGWQFTNKNVGGSGKSGSAHQYKTMTSEQIAQMPVKDIAAKDSILYLWTTNQHLVTGSIPLVNFLEIMGVQCNLDKSIKVQSDALSVMYSHGFKPKHIITWEKENKNGWGGYSFNNVTEHLLIGTRGLVPAFGLTAKTIISTKWDKQHHSKKPQESWDLIEKIIKASPWQTKKLAMNQREKRKGWTNWGNQVQKKTVSKK